MNKSKHSDIEIENEVATISAKEIFNPSGISKLKNDFGIVLTSKCNFFLNQKN